MNVFVRPAPARACLLAVLLVVLLSCTSRTAPTIDATGGPLASVPESDDSPVNPPDRPGKTTPDTEASLDDLRRELTSSFDALLADPRRYQTRVRAECRRFPEGDLFPYTLTAIAYANLALAGAEPREHVLDRMAPLLEAAVASVVAKVRPPDGRLERLGSTRGHGCYLGQLNLALAYWKLAGGDDRFTPVHERLTAVLADALEQSSGRPIKSFPDYDWTFDTVPALVSVAAFEVHTPGSARARPLLDAHRRWVRDSGTDPGTGLPWSRIGPGDQGLTDPRGCDLSWRIALLAHIDREWAGELYQRYTASFWLDRGMMAGFAEWPRGGTGREDLDSGPIFQGIGSSASVLGLGATIAIDDQVRRPRLEQQLALRRLALPLVLTRDAHTGRQMIGGMIEYDPAYTTGFLYGDVVLFSSATWHEWPR